MVVLLIIGFALIGVAVALAVHGLYRLQAQEVVGPPTSPPFRFTYLFAGRMLFLTALFALGVLLGTGNLFVALIAFALVIAGARLHRAWIYQNWLRALEAQLPNAMLVLNGGLKAGRSIEQCFELVAKSLTPPISDEFAHLAQQIRLGTPFADAVRQMMDRIESEELRLALQAMLFQRETGGNLQEVFDEVSFVTTQRTNLRDYVKAMTAMLRFTAWTLMVLPFVTAGLILMLNRKYAEFLLSYSEGQRLLGLALVMLLIGAVWVWRLTQQPVLGR